LTSSTGYNPVQAVRWFWANSNVTPTYYQIRTANLATIRPLYTADSVGGNPATSNVRSGTVYGPNSELTGTCAVPPAASVGVGVPVDNTTGTAAITAASIRSAIGLAAADLDTQLAALPTAAEVRIEMDSSSTKLGADTSGTTTLLSRLTSGRAGNLDNLDATVSSRPTAADIATAVWAAATRTLTTAIDNSATIAAAVWAYASGRTITGGTVTDLTNAPDVPTEAEIATAVRTELSTELGRIDVATSTRLAAASYSAAPSAATTAGAVRSELATELGRLDAAVSSRLAPSGTLARVTLVDTTTTVTNSSQVDNAAIADAVRVELTPELARVANAATTQEVGDIVEEAMNP
jgi:hypothetical protein